MTNKFSYMDFLMYILPGSILELSLLLIWWILGLQIPTLFGEGGLLDSLLFVLVAFVLGHIIQGFAHWIPEMFLKKVFWGGLYPSHLLLFRGSNLIGEYEREKTIALLRSESKIKDDAVLGAWEKGIRRIPFRILLNMSKDEFNRSAQAAQFLFHRLRSYLGDSNLGVRANVAEAYYQFHRGAYSASGLGGVALLAVFLTSSSASEEKSSIALLCACIQFTFSFIFFWRARGAGQNLAREVLRSYISDTERRTSEESRDPTNIKNTGLSDS